jgi:DNA-binding transcriptional regulator YdaS (Cro superfamily)
VDTGLEKSIEVAGGLSSLAALLGTTVQVVSNWRSRGVVPVERVIDVARCTGFQVTPHDLRPDIYPNATDGVPPQVGVEQGRAAA